MAAPARATAHTTATAAELNQIIDLLEGGDSKTEAFKLISSSGENFIIKLSDASGVRKFSIQDSAGVEVAYINSDGALSLAGGLTVSAGNLLLPASTSPAVTTDAAIQWDSDDNRIMVGDGAALQTFYPGATQYKYKTAAQNFTDATLADVTATSGNMAFTALANTAYLIRYRLNVTAVGTAATDGLQLAVTHPSTPASVHYLGSYQSFYAGTGLVTTGAETGATITATAQTQAPFSSVTTTSGTAVMSSVAGTAAIPGGGGTPAVAGIIPGIVEMEVLFVNGANAGLVTLQAACAANGAGTTTIDDSQMVVQQVIVAS